MKPPFGARLVKPYSHCGLWAAVNRGNEMGSEYGINRRSCGPRAQFETRTISPGDRVGAGLALPYTHTRPAAAESVRMSASRPYRIGDPVVAKNRPCEPDPLPFSQERKLRILSHWSGR